MKYLLNGLLLNNMKINAEPNISAEAKGHGISAKAPGVAVLMLARPLNYSFCGIEEII
jgi:hypothetical protein